MGTIYRITYLFVKFMKMAFWYMSTRQIVDNFIVADSHLTW